MGMFFKPSQSFEIVIIVLKLNISTKEYISVIGKKYRAENVIESEVSSYTKFYDTFRYV